MYQKFLKQYTDFVFVEHSPAPSDIIFIPGNGYPQMAEYAAGLWRKGLAPLLLPSGKYSTLTGRFSGVQSRQSLYPGPYETEWAFLRDVLIKNGVPESSILREDSATYTYENAIQSRKLTDSLGLKVRRAILCCHAWHARRCLLYYQLLFPEAEILVCPSDTGVNRENWYKTGDGIDLVLGEVERCGSQFHLILRDI